MAILNELNWHLLLVSSMKHIYSCELARASPAKTKDSKFVVNTYATFLFGIHGKSLRC